MVALAVVCVGVTGQLMHRHGRRRARRASPARDLRMSARHAAAEAAPTTQSAGGWRERWRARSWSQDERVQDHSVASWTRRAAAPPGSPAAPPAGSASSPGRRRRPRASARCAPAARRGGYLRHGAREPESAGLSGDLRRAAAGGGPARRRARAAARPVRRAAAGAAAAPADRGRAPHGARGDRDARGGPGGRRETRELARTLDRLAAALRRQDELRRATVADVAHELRNALVGVVGRIEALQDGMVADEKRRSTRTKRATRDGSTGWSTTCCSWPTPSGPPARAQAAARPRRVSPSERAAHADRLRRARHRLRVRAPCRRASTATPGGSRRSRQPALQRPALHRSRRPRAASALDVRDGEAVLRGRRLRHRHPARAPGRIFDRFWRDSRGARARRRGLRRRPRARRASSCWPTTAGSRSRAVRATGSTLRVFLPLAVDRGRGSPLVREPQARVRRDRRRPDGLAPARRDRHRERRADRGGADRRGRRAARSTSCSTSPTWPSSTRPAWAPSSPSRPRSACGRRPFRPRGRPAPRQAGVRPAAARRVHGSRRDARRRVGAGIQPLSDPSGGPPAVHGRRPAARSLRSRARPL